MNILLVGDPHASPDTDNNRFDYLGNMILELAPDMVVCMGDFGDMGSLSSYDRGKRAFEGRRYRLDIEAVHDALKRINKPLEDYNRQKKSIRKAQRSLPIKKMLYGNHDMYRIERAINASPELEGVLDVKDLRYEEYGWQTYPFKQPVEIEGIWLNHYFPSGVKGEAISGFAVANSLLQKNFASSIVGHSHLFDYAIRKRPDGQSIIGLSTGWFGEKPTYEDATESLWWSGLIYLRDVKSGVFDIEQYSMERIKRLYA